MIRRAFRMHLDQIQNAWGLIFSVGHVVKIGSSFSRANLFFALVVPRKSVLPWVQFDCVYPEFFWCLQDKKVIFTLIHLFAAKKNFFFVHKCVVFIIQIKSVRLSFLYRVWGRMMFCACFICHQGDHDVDSCLMLMVNRFISNKRTMNLSFSVSFIWCRGMWMLKHLVLMDHIIGSLFNWRCLHIGLRWVEFWLGWRCWWGPLDSSFSRFWTRASSTRSRGIWTTNDVIYLVVSTWVRLSRKVNRGEAQHSAASAN